MQKLIILFFFTSCAFIYSGSKDREIQTKIISSINQKSAEFSSCAKKFDLFKQFESNRLRVMLYLDINPLGNVEKFKLDETRQYPENFTNCIFSTVELIDFPSFKSHELIKIEQPFIFSKK